MLEFLQKLREEHKDDDDVLIALGEIESELNAKKYGLVWEQHEEAVDVQIAFTDALVEKYHLTSDKQRNRMILAGNGYVIGDEILGQALHGVFVRTDMVAEATSYYSTRKRVDTHKHGMQLLHSTDAIKTAIGLSTGKVKTILERLFRKGVNPKKKLLALNTVEFYAFVINNERLLRDEFRQITAGMSQQLGLMLEPKKGDFHIPEQDFFKYDPGVKEEIEYLSNAYQEYTSGYATSLVRSMSEQLFEQYCESWNDIEWVYKNGDTGQQYFSIVYLDALRTSGCSTQTTSS